MTIKTDLTRRSFIKTAGAGAVAVPMVMTDCGADDSENNKKSRGFSLCPQFC